MTGSLNSRTGLLSGKSNSLNSSGATHVYSSLDSTPKSNSDVILELHNQAVLEQEQAHRSDAELHAALEAQDSKDQEWWLRLKQDAGTFPTISIHDGIAWIFAGGFTYMGMYLYYDGAKNRGIEYIIGGVGSNAVQYLYYTEDSYHGIVKMGKKREFIKLASGVLLGFLTSAPQAFAEHNILAKEGNQDLMIVAFTFLGNVPLNTYGMISIANQIASWWHNNKYVRLAVLAMMKNPQITAEQLESIIIMEKVRDLSLQHNLFLAMCAIPGFTLGTALVLSQAGYVSSSIEEMRDLLGASYDVLAEFFGVFSNMPSLLIAFFIGGRKLANDIAHLILNFRKHFEGLSRREIAYLTADLGSIAAMAVLANYSSATSVKLYDTNPHIFPDAVEPVTSFCTDYMTRGFNAILASKATNSFVSFFRNRVTPQNAEYAKFSYQLAEKQAQKGPIEQVTAVAELGLKSKGIVEGTERYNNIMSPVPFRTVVSSMVSSLFCRKKNILNEPLLDKRQASSSSLTG